jgi:hypothetical protein
MLKSSNSLFQAMSEKVGGVRMTCCPMLDNVLTKGQATHSTTSSWSWSGPSYLKTQLTEGKHHRDLHILLLQLPIAALIQFRTCGTF